MVHGITNYEDLPPQGDPDVYAQQYANEHGLTLEEAKAELRSRYGDPQPPMFMSTDAQETYNNISNADLKQPLFNINYSSSEVIYANVNQDDPKTATLRKLGIPDDVIKQGDDAVRKYAEEHGIKLPPPPRPPQGQQDCTHMYKC